MYMYLVHNKLWDQEYILSHIEKPPIEYWQVLAEQRRQALADTLQENEEVKFCALYMSIEGFHIVSYSMYSHILMHDAVAMPHKLPPLFQKNPVWNPDVHVHEQ